jgi:tetratricopeptide (TPR) repeat protein
MITCLRDFLGTRALVLAAGLLTSVAPARAQNDGTADQHFKRGVRLASEGDVQAALSQFEQAYAISPHFAVLYNIGRAHSLAGRPAEAIAALQRYLADGGDAVPSARRALVLEMIQHNLSTMGLLAVELEPTTAVITIDGVEQPQGATEVRLAAGRHSFLVTADGYLPRAGHVVVSAGGTAELNVPLSPLPRLPAFFDPTCRIPGVNVSVDGRLRAETPTSAPIEVSPGRHVIAFSRSGYLGTARTLPFSEGQRLTVDCELVERSDLSAAESARLVVTASEADAEVFVNRARFAGQALPHGRHHIEVLRAGFASHSDSVFLAPGKTTVTEVALQPTPTYERAYRERAERQRALAIAGGGAGLVLGVVAGGLYVDNASRFADWKEDRASLDADLLDGDVTTADVRRSRELHERASTIQAVDDAAIGIAIAGGVLMVASALYWWFAPDPNRYSGKASHGSATLPATWGFR